MGASFICASFNLAGGLDREQELQTGAARKVGRVLTRSKV